MPVDVALFTGRNLAYLRFHGDVTPDDSLDALKRILSDGRTRANTAQLADFSAVRHMVADFLQTLCLVAAEARLSARVTPGTRYALYAPGDLAFGAARMFDQLAETALPYHIEAFRDEEQALAHLRQPERRISEFLIAAE